MGQWTRQHTFDPRAAGATVACWYRLDRGVTLNGSSISALADQSAIGDSNRDLTQGTALNQPTYTAAASAYKGQPIAVGAGVASQFMLSGTWSAALATPCFWMAIADSDAVGIRCIFDRQTASEHTMFVNAATQNIACFAGSTLASSTSVTNPSVVACELNGASSKLYANALTAVATGAAGTNTLPSLTFMASFSTLLANSWTGSVAELIGFSTVPSTSQKESIMRYAAMRIGLSLAL